jgi:hypothetical protein
MISLSCDFDRHIIMISQDGDFGRCIMILSSCDFDRHIIMISSACDFDRHHGPWHHHLEISTDTSSCEFYRHIMMWKGVLARSLAGLARTLFSTAGTHALSHGLSRTTASVMLALQRDLCVFSSPKSTTQPPPNVFSAVDSAIINDHCSSMVLEPACLFFHSKKKQTNQTQKNGRACWGQ